MELPADIQVSLEKIPLDMVFPPLKSIAAASDSYYSVASQPYIDGAYVKMPAFSKYTGKSGHATLTSREEKTCELLKRHPHPTLLRLRGVFVHEGSGRTVGLCFKKYQFTLVERRCNSDAPLDVQTYLTEVRRAVDHLHGLGLCHNDIKPGNIMIDEDDTPVLIDFDSAYFIGAKPEGGHKTGTFRLSDPSFMVSHVSRKENDYYSLNVLTTYLRA